jgi:hypothetical protein
MLIFQKELQQRIKNIDIIKACRQEKETILTKICHATLPLWRDNCDIQYIDRENALFLGP